MTGFRDQTSTFFITSTDLQPHITWVFTPHHIVLSGRAATANRGHSDVNPPPAPLVSVEGTKASLQEKKKQNQTTFAAAKKTRPAGNKSKIRNYNNKDWKSHLI